MEPDFSQINSEYFQEASPGLESKRFWRKPKKFKPPPVFVVLIAIIIVLSLPLLIVAKSFLNKKPAPPLSPLSEPSKNNISKDYNEYKSVSFYITTSQEILNKARRFAEETSKNSRQQTPEEKQKIIELVNQALDIINQGIAGYPLDDRVFAQRANIYQALTPFLPQANSLAIQDIKEAIKLNRQNPNYYLTLANLYFTSGDFEGAAFAFYNAHLLSPTDNQILYSLADALEKSGQLTKAKYYFEKLQSLLPPSDQNQEALKTRITNLTQAISKANLQYLSEPGETSPPVPAASANDKEILGTQELPIQEALLTQNVIIAGSQEENKNNLKQEINLNALSGEGKIPAGQTEVTIKTTKLNLNQQIIVIPKGKTKNKLVFLKAQKPCSQQNLNDCWFKVGLDQPADSDIEFNWWIVDKQ